MKRISSPRLFLDSTHELVSDVSTAVEKIEVCLWTGGAGLGAGFGETEKMTAFRHNTEWTEEIPPSQHSPQQNQPV